VKLKDIKKIISTFPTVMDIDDELLIISQLMDVDINELIKNKHVLFKIIDDLEISHMDSGFMQLTEKNEGEFIKFHKWLTTLQHTYHLEISNNTMEIFNLTVADVEKLMPRS